MFFIESSTKALADSPGHRFQFDLSRKHVFKTMAERLRTFFRGNFLACVAIVCTWFIYAALRDGVFIHNHFLGISSGLKGPHAYPPWIVTMAVEGVLVAWYFLPAAAYRRPLRWVEALFGLFGLILLLVEPTMHSRPIVPSFELVVATYVFASHVGYAIFWPTEDDLGSRLVIGGHFYRMGFRQRLPCSQKSFSLRV